MDSRSLAICWTPTLFGADTFRTPTLIDPTFVHYAIEYADKIFPDHEYDGLKFSVFHRRYYSYFSLKGTYTKYAIHALLNYCLAAFGL